MTTEPLLKQYPRCGALGPSGVPRRSFLPTNRNARTSRPSLSLGARLSGRRTLAHVGSALPPAQRFRLRGEQTPGIGTDRSIRYKDIAPWYDHAERFAGSEWVAGRIAPVARRTIPPAHGLCTRFRFPLCHYGDQGIIVRRVTTSAALRAPPRREAAAAKHRRRRALLHWGLAGTAGGLVREWSLTIACSSGE